MAKQSVDQSVEATPSFPLERIDEYCNQWCKYQGCDYVSNREYAEKNLKKL